jgi:hypothetical protein
MDKPEDIIIKTEKIQKIEENYKKSKSILKIDACHTNVYNQINPNLNDKPLNSGTLSVNQKKYLKKLINGTKNDSFSPFTW